jgi:CBS-domain-containing membrane protein
MLTRTDRSKKCLTLRAATARDLMSDRPISVRANATVADAVELLTMKGFSVAPVIDESGRSVGVLSHSDILIHERECAARERFSGEAPTTLVRDIMTPAMFSVSPNASAASVVEQMLELNVHHLFVVDAAGVVLGVIGTFDILRNLSE